MLFQLYQTKLLKHLESKATIPTKVWLPCLKGALYQRSLYGYSVIPSHCISFRPL